MSIWCRMMVSLCCRVKGMGCRETMLLDIGDYLKVLVFILGGIFISAHCIINNH